MDFWKFKKQVKTAAIRPTKLKAKPEIKPTAKDLKIRSTLLNCNIKKTDKNPTEKIAHTVNILWKETEERKKKP